MRQSENNLVHHIVEAKPIWNPLLKLLGGALAAWLLLTLLTSERGIEASIRIFSAHFLGIFIEAAPFLLLGALASGMIETFVSPDDIARWLPRRPWLAVPIGVFVGFALPVSEIGVLPVVRRLFTKGLPLSVGVTFLLAAPVLNPIVAAGTFIAFGAGPLFIGRFVITALVAATVGLVFVLAQPQEALRPQATAPVRDAGATTAGLPARQPFWPGLRHALSLAGDEFFEMGRYLIIGALLAAAAQSFISQEALLAAGRGPVASVPRLQAHAFTLGVGSTVDTFLAPAFAGSFPTGSLLAFLTFGPMVDIKSMVMLLSIFRRRAVLVLILIPLLMTMGVGIWLNLNVVF